MTLIEAAFKRHASNRSMSFEVIVDETRLPVSEVEHLVMKALFFFGLLFVTRKGCLLR